MQGLTWTSCAGACLPKRDRGICERRAARLDEIDKFQRARWKRQRRDGDALPKRVEKVIETGNALVTEAQGLGRGR
jgi:hypothetical protein